MKLVKILMVVGFYLLVNPMASAADDCRFGFFPVLSCGDGSDANNLINVVENRDFYNVTMKGGDFKNYEVEVGSERIFASGHETIYMQFHKYECDLQEGQAITCNAKGEHMVKDIALYMARHVGDLNTSIPIITEIKVDKIRLHVDAKGVKLTFVGARKLGHQIDTQVVEVAFHGNGACQKELLFSEYQFPQRLRTYLHGDL